MKKFKILVNEQDLVTTENSGWKKDFFANDDDIVYADTAEEAVELAIDFFVEQSNFIDSEDVLDFDKTDTSVIVKNADGSSIEYSFKAEMKENNLTVYRKKANLTQEKLSEMSGIKQQNISRLESGERSLNKLTLGVAVKLAKALNISTEQLL